MAALQAELSEAHEGAAVTVGVPWPYLQDGVNRLTSLVLSACSISRTALNTERQQQQFLG